MYIIHQIPLTFEYYANILILGKDHHTHATAQYTAQSSLTAAMRAYATKHDQKDFISMRAGQSSSKAVRGTTAEIFMKLVNDAFSS